MAVVTKSLLFCLLTIIVLATPVTAEQNAIILQSTTSTENSGLFAHILPLFTRQTGIVVKVVAVGTGQALKNGRNGDGDVILVHAKAAELRFVEDGFGVVRYDVMVNDFIIVGPEDDPAKISGMIDARAAFTKIAAGQFLFVSRGDDSGTNKKELALWQDAGIDVAGASGSWYRETGSGMGATLNIANGMGAYTLSDRATWIAFNNKSAMAIISQGDQALLNQYGVMLVNPKKHPHVNARDGQIFIDWIAGEIGQAAIAAYRLNGQQLFFPNARQ